MKIKKYDELLFTDDYLFCKILTDNLELCKNVIEVILGLEISKIELSEAQKSIEIISNAHGVRLDVYVEDENNTVYDIEMQTTQCGSLPKRSRYYQGMIDLHLIERGESYSGLKDSIVIFICKEDPFGKGIPVYSFENVCHEIPCVKLNDGSEKIFLNASSNMASKSKELDGFLNYIRYCEPYSELTKNIEAEVEKARYHNEWRMEYMTLQMKYNDFLEEGKEEGRREGIKEGIKEGRREGEYLIVSKMIDQGIISLEEGVKCLGVTAEQFEKIIGEIRTD